MSNLPHGLGSAVAGQLFYPGAPQVTAYDVAGAAGSRAVEFGEDGVSAATNRMGYALAKNDEYQQARLEAPIAKPNYTSWTPSGGSGASYSFTGVDLFVGDATYLPETQSIRDSLICVLDAAFNEILDVYGNRVVVKSIKNYGETASIVGDPSSAGGNDDGFYPGGAVIRFKSVDPVSGVDSLPTVTIPDGTSVVLVHGIAGTLDSLATIGQQHLMRDMLVRGTVRSATHIPAASFLRDGSRAMLANADMGAHGVVNCQSLQGTGGSPLDIKNVAGSGERIFFSDSNVTNAALSNPGCTTPYTPGGFWPSILGVLNSNARLNEKMHGNRVIDKGGVLDWQAGYINVPAMVIALNGEAVDVAAQRFPLVGTVTPNVTRYLVVDNAGALAERATVLSSDAIIAYYRWNGASWDTNVDSRWTFNGTTASFEVTVGPSTYRGADFTSLQEACDFVASISSAKPEGRWTIRICGEVELSDTLNLDIYSNYVHMTIAGDNPKTSVIKTSTSFAVAKHLIKVNGLGPSGDNNRVDFRDLTFKWASTVGDQDVGYGAICNPGNYSITQNCVFSGSTYGFANGVYFLAMTSPTPRGFKLLDSYFSQIKRSIVDVNGLAYQIMVDRCVAEDCNSSSYAFLLSTTNNQVLRTFVFGDGTNNFDYGVQIGHLGEVSGCRLVVYGGAAVTIDNPLVGTVKADVSNNYFELATSSSALYVHNTTGQNCQISFHHNTVNNGAYGVNINNGSLHTGLISVLNNRFSGQTVTAILGTDYARDIHIVGNHFVNQAGIVINLLDNYNARIENNKITGYGPLGTHSGLRLLEGTLGTSQAVVNGNYFGAAGAHVNSAFFWCQIDQVVCSNNRFEGHNGSAYILIQIYSNYGGNGRFYGNTFDAVGSYSMMFEHVASAEYGSLHISGNSFQNAGVASISIQGLSGSKISGNNFGGNIGTVGRSIQILVGVSGNPRSTAIEGNTFYRVQGAGTVRAVIYNDNVNNTGMTVTGNNFRECGLSSGAAFDQDIVHCRGRQATITGNTFNNCYGAADTSSTQTLVKAYGYCTISGNTFYQDVSAATMTRGTYNAVLLAGDFGVVTGNMFNITGAATNVLNIWVITNVPGTHRHTITGNRFTAWTNATGGSTNNPIKLDTATDSCIVMGNGAEAFEIDATTATHLKTSMVLGNACWQTGMLVQKGTNADAVNISS